MSSDLVFHALLVFLGMGIFLGLRSRRKRLRYGPLPPSLKPRLISGNVHQLEGREFWESIMSMYHEIGSRVHSFSVFGRTIIVINDYKCMTDLFETKAANYSDRRKVWMLNHLMDRHDVPDMSSEDPNFKIHKRILQNSLNQRSERRYKALKEEEMRNLIRKLTETPEDFMAHFRRNVVAVIMKAAYGWTVSGDHDRFVKYVEEAFRIGMEVRTPGKFLVEAFPILRFVPSWFPGGGFKRQAKIWKKHLHEAETIPHEWAKQQIASGDYVESFTSFHMRPEDGHRVSAEEESVIRLCSFTLFLGASDTIVGVIIPFVAHMLLYPHVMRRAQTEIDRVLAKSRLPSVDDLTSLTYLAAIYKETLRLTPSLPAGVPHVSLRDDHYAGYYIPAGTEVLPNTWAVLHDQEMYPEADAFIPERFLCDEPPLDPRKIAFGFGRRACPGMHFSEVSVMLNMAAILAVFDIEKPLDDDGKEIEPIIEYFCNFTRHPKPFKCRFVPRPHAEAVLQQT